MFNSVIAVVLATQLWASRPAEPPTTWFVALDTSGSVTQAEFAEYPEIVRACVLRLLRPGDSMVLLGVLDPAAMPIVPPLSDRPVQFQRDLVALDARIRTIARTTGRHRTDLGGVIAHVAKRMALDVELQSGARRYVVVIVTDGVPDGRQTRSGPGPASQHLARGDWRVLFVGVRPDAEAALPGLTGAAGLTQIEHVRIVPFPFWRQVADQLPAFLGRTVNPRSAGLLSR